ncbi:unnamed protein product [Tilletia controversa]|nr:unnamed protein product [Tilletia controversa]
MRTDLLPTLYLTLLASWLLLAAAQSAPASTRDRDLALRSARHHNANIRRGGKSPGAGDGPHSTHDGSSKPGQASGAQIPRPRSAADLVLTDIVLVTTVEGGIYGLDRATGSTIWEVPAHTASSAIPGEEPFAGFGPLVRSTYGPKRSSFVELLQGGAASSSGSYAGGLASPPTRPAYASDDDQGPNADAVALLEQVGIYVVEPSSAGDIYMLTPASPKSGASPGGDEQQGEGADPLSVPRTHLSKLPLTLPQLVQLSPFSFAGDDTRIFIGHKSTTLVELDIATGSIGAVWGGSSPDSAATNASFDDHSTHGHDQARRPWTYIGRTDYTLTIHARNRPALSQTLHFSTYAPTAADLDIQTIWAQAGHPDQRAVIGTGEQQTVVCFNTTSSASHAGAPATTVAEDQDERTVWRTSIGGTVAGIFDIVQPSSVTARAEYHGSGTTATSKSPAPAAAASPAASSARYHAGGARPVIVPHPPISLSSLFGSSRQVSVGLGMPSSRRAGGIVNADDDDDDNDDDDDAERDQTEDENGQSPLFDLQSMGMSDSQRPAYLGFSGGSLFAMGSSKFPLAAFSPRAAAGLPGSTTADGPSDLPSGRPSPFEEFGRSDGADPNTGMSVRPCSAFGCWLGSYPVEVDAETDRNAQEALLGSARRPLGIADHHEAYDFWGVPSRSVPAIDAPPARSEGTGPERGSSSSGPGTNSSLEEDEGEGGKRSGSKMPSLTTLLFQVIGLGCITLFSYALILGVNEQQRQNEERSNQLAEVVTLCDQDAPYMTEEQAGLQMVINPKTGLPVLVMPEPETPPQAFASPSSVTATPQLKEKPLPATPITLEEMERARRMAEEDEAVAAELSKKKEEFQRLAQATDVNTLAAFIEQQQQQQQQQNGAGSSSANGHSNLADSGRPTSSAGGGATPNGKSGPGGGGGKRRRRGKRAGAALAAKVAARAAAAAGLDVGDGEDEEGDEDDTGEGSPPPAMLVNGRPSPPGSAGAGASGGGGKKGGAPLLKQNSDRKSNGVRFLEQDATGVKLPPNRLTATGLASASTLGAGAVAGADVFGTYPGPYSPTTTALLDGGWLQAGPDSQSAEEQLAKMAALASTPGSMRGPGSGGGGGNGDGRSEEIGMGIGIGIGNSGSAGRQVVSKSSGLTISDEVLGYGSSGTVVFKGTFQGRAVAVKRLLRDFVNVASKEVSLLESADNHPNVIRYFYKELTGSFLYIALELCPASLADVIDKPNEFRDLYNILEPKRALQQIASGVRHLHSLHTVMPNSKRLKMLLSDFGLSKRLDGLAQSSFSQTVNNPGGTVGWRAPEILRGDVQLDNGGGSESEQSSIGVASDGTRERGPAEERKRLTRAVDIFALGCVAYYVLANGEHPFGSRFEREMNIIRNCKNLSRLDGLGEEGVEAQHLINTMIAVEPRERPSASDVLSHPYFWDAGKRLNFLQEASDRFEIMERDPPAAPLVALEAQSVTVLGGEWYKKVDRAFVDDLGKFRKYDSRSVQDLLRALRNKKHHYQDLSPHLKKLLGPLPGGFLAYFTRRFPLLFMHVHSTLSSQSLLPHEAQFREYFEPNEHEH